MTNVVSIFGKQNETHKSIIPITKSMLGAKRISDTQLFRSAVQARRYFGAVSNKMPINEYGGTAEAATIAEDIFALSHAHHSCVRTTEKLIAALLLSIRNSSEKKIHNFRLVDGEGSVFMGYADGESFTLKIARNHKENLANGSESFESIVSMEFLINKGQVFFLGQATER